MTKMSRFVVVLHMLVCLTVVAASPSVSEEQFTAHAIGWSLAKCLGEPKIFPCLQRETVHNLDLILRDNSTWKYSDFIEFEKDQEFVLPDQSATKRSADSDGEEIAEKLIQLAQSRLIRLRVIPRSLDAETKDFDPDEGGDDNTRKYQKIWYLNDSLKGRKKKEKGMGMFGGLAMVAMLAQMFLGKVMLIAGSAFVMAKIALMVSLLTSLKTKSSGSGSTEHVVTYTDAGGSSHSGTGHSGYHRSLPNYDQFIPVQDPVEVEHHSSPHIPDYYQFDGSTQAHDDYKFI